MKFIKNENWGLRLLALVLAIVVYHALKNETTPEKNDHGKTFFNSTAR